MTKQPTPYIPRPADLILVRSDSFIGRAIRWATRRRGEAATYANHVAGMTQQRLVVEALATVSVSRWDQFCMDNKCFEVWRLKDINTWGRRKVSCEACAYAKRDYGWLKIATHLADALVNKISRREVFLFRRLNHADRYPICSWLWAEAYDKALGYRFGVEPNMADPDHMHDHVRKSGKWKMVYRQG